MIQKCNFCGRKLLSPKLCPYCRKTFCPEHELPKKHQCWTSTVKKLKNVGVDKLVAQVLKAFAKEYPQYKEKNYLPPDYLRLFWAREYSITRNMRYQLPELDLIITQVEAKLSLDLGLRRTPLQPPSLQRNIDFENKTYDELVEEVLKHMEELYKQNPEDMSLVVDPHSVSTVIRDFLQHRYPGWSSSLSNPLVQIRLRKVENAVYRRWQEKVQVRIFNDYFRKLPPEEKEKAQPLKELMEKTVEELADDIVSYFEKKEQWLALLNRSPQGPRNTVFKELERKFLPEDLDITNRMWMLYEKWRDVKRLLIHSKLPEAEERVYNLLKSNILKWVETRNEMPTKREIADVLKTMGLSGVPTRLKQNLYDDIKEEFMNR